MQRERFRFLREIRRMITAIRVYVRLCAVRILELLISRVFGRSLF